MLKIELYKIMRKKEFIILMCMLLSPLIFSVLIYTGHIKAGDIDVGALSLPGFIAIVFGFFEQLCVLGLITGILAVSTLSAEIDCRHVLLYFPRIPSRKRLYLEKSIALTIAFAIWFLCFTVVSTASYCLLLFGGSNEVSGVITDEHTIEWLLATASTFFYILFIMQSALFIGAFQKPLVSILCLLGITYGSILLCNIPGLGNLLPVHYSQAAMELLGKNSTKLVLTNYTISIAVSLLYILLTNFIGRKRVLRLEV